LKLIITIGFNIDRLEHNVIHFAAGRRAMERTANLLGGDEYMSTTQARKLLNVSPAKMARLIAEGVLTYYIHPLDKRKKLVKMQEVQALKERAPDAATRAA
jgi:hypothetical protein